MALPLLVAVTIGLVWLLGVGAAQLRIVDPLLGVQLVQQPLLPAQPLVDWSQA